MATHSHAHIREMAEEAESMDISSATGQQQSTISAVESTYLSAVRSARSFQHDSFTHFRSLQDLIPHMKAQYESFDSAFFNKVKGEVIRVREHPAMAVGVCVTAGLMIMRGPRRFLFRHTLGRLQSEEAKFIRAEKNVRELNLSVDLMKKESRKLLERTGLAEKDMKRGHTELMNSGSQIQHLAKSVNKVENQTADLMEGLREIPGREALRLRAEVASMASLLKRQRVALDKRITKISELGIPI